MRLSAPDLNALPTPVCVTLVFAFCVLCSCSSLEALHVGNEKMKGNAMRPKPENIVGTYTDDWLGDIMITHDGNNYSIKSKRSPVLFGELLPYNTTTYVAKWNNRSFDADVFLQFTFNEKGEAVSVCMKYIAPITDFSFDFHDLELIKTN